MLFIGKNKIPVKYRFLVLLGFFVFVFIAIRLPYLNLLFPLWVIITLSFMLINFLFQFTFKLNGLFLMSLWVLAMGVVLLQQEAIAEEISISVIIIFAGIVVHKFFQERKIYFHEK